MGHPRPPATESVITHVPRDLAPASPRSLYGGPAHLQGRFFAPGWWLVVPVPGDGAYKELVLGALTPWMSAHVRSAKG
ncbi:hypothetical protein AB0451_10400 [Streptomyces sp. NPDC052000]|uniref:hypothetical protein n=1 Tax=Streptomyces sp. NPDC052000 TaxID=3155676 RepID=UPI0034502C24